MKAAIITKGSGRGIYLERRVYNWANKGTGMGTVDVAKLSQNCDDDSGMPRSSRR